MGILYYIGVAFTGALLCNAIPHLASGLMGNPFPTPFAKPPGKGDSPPLVNALWGSFNMFAGLFLFSACPFALGFNIGFILFMAGFVLLALFTSLHFGKVRRGK